MPITAKHSPTPWKVVTDRMGTFVEAPSLMIGSLQAPSTVARVDYGSPLTYPENAAHIVRCVNAHDALVAALETCIDGLLHFVDDDGNNCIQDARAALASARGTA